MSDRALVHRAAYDIGVPSRAMQVDPHVEFLGRPIGYFFFLVGRKKAACGSRIPNLEDMWARSVRTEV